LLLCRPPLLRRDLQQRILRNFDSDQPALLRFSGVIAVAITVEGYAEPFLEFRLCQIYIRALRILFTTTVKTSAHHKLRRGRDIRRLTQQLADGFGELFMTVE